MVQALKKLRQVTSTVMRSLGKLDMICKIYATVFCSQYVVSYIIYVRKIEKFILKSSKLLQISKRKLEFPNILGRQHP